MLAPTLLWTLTLACSSEEPEWIEGKIYWSFETAGPVHSSPALYEDAVFVGSDDGYLYAIGARSGKERWRFATGGGSASPVVVDGSVYVGSEDGWFYSIGANSGTEQWSVYLGAGVSGGAAVADGVVYVGAWDRAVYAFDAATGEEIWTYLTANEIHASPAVADGVVYVSSWDGKVYALDAESGEARWNFKAGDYVSAAPVVADGQIFVGAEYEVPTTDDGIFHALTPTGRTNWSFWTGEGLHVGAAAEVQWGVAYFGTQDWYTDDRSDYLHAVSTTSGQELWAFAVTDSVVSKPAVSDQRVFFQDESEYLYALSTTDGAEIWRYPTGGGRSGPVVEDSIVYVGGGDSNMIWALREPR